ncbi:TlpA family protein disulfide reductase [Sphingobacterium sp. MYb382]|uniref:TlpA family protein disulfide reductase n=1 Tax=Sphingobacterium sp. MYb382 TaxID=2745278 RepID=UPI00309E0360
MRKQTINFKMKYILLLLLSLAALYSSSAEKQDSLVLYNTSTNNSQYYNYQDGYGNFVSFELKPARKHTLYFEGSTVINSAASSSKEMQILCLGSDNLYLQDIKLNKVKSSSHKSYIINKTLLADTTTDNKHDTHIDYYIKQNLNNQGKLDDLPLLKESLAYLVIYNQLTRQELLHLQDRNLVNSFQPFLMDEKPNVHNDLHNATLTKSAFYAYQNKSDQSISIFNFIIQNYPEKYHEVLLFNALKRLIVNQKDSFKINYPLFKGQVKSERYASYLFNMYSSIIVPEKDLSMLIRYSDLKLISLDSLRFLYPEQKLIYDLSASWCAPCIDGIPKLVAHSKKMNIQYIILSIDSDINAWKPVMDEHKLNPANNYFLVGGSKSPFAIKNSITSIPRCLLINELGEIVNSNYLIH